MFLNDRRYQLLSRRLVRSRFLINLGKHLGVNIRIELLLVLVALDHALHHLPRLLHRRAAEQEEKNSQFL